MLPPGSLNLLPDCSGLDAFPIGLPFRSAFKRQSRAPIEEWKWDLYQSVITDLYRTKRKRLRDVMEILEQRHNFLPTEKMLKDQIRKWGLDKKLKAREVHAIRKMKQRRDVLGKKSQFYIRGRLVTWEEIERYSKRSRLLVKLQDEDTVTVEIGHSTGIVCKTPPPDPVALSVPPIVNGPDAVQRPDEVLRISRDYCQGMIEGAQWKYDPERARICGPGGFQAYQRLCRWRTKILQSCEHLPQTKEENHSHDLTRSFRLIESCLEELSEIIKDQDRSLIFALLYTTDKLREKHQEIGHIVVGYILQLSRTRLGNDHHITHLWKRLWATDMADPSRLCAAETFLDSLNYLQAHGGFATSSIFADGYYYYMLALLGREGVRIMLVHSKNLRTAMEMTASGQPIDPPVPAPKEKQRIAQALIHVSAYLTDAEEFEEVKQAMHSVHRWLTLWEDESGDNHDIKQCVFYCEANISRQKGDWEEAKEISRKQYEHGRQVYGPGKEKTLTTLQQHIQDVQKSGHQDEAERLQAEYDELRRTWIETQATRAAT